MIFHSLLLFIPISFGLKYFASVPALWTFITSAAAIGVLSEWIRRATEELAKRVGPAVGGLLMVSFGSIAELTLAMFVLASGDTAVVQAQITGSIIGTSLFGLGLAALVGGLTRDRQTFSAARAGLLSSLLLLVVIALLLPAVFDYTGRAEGSGRDLRITNEELSLGASGVLLILYVGNLVYTLLTHRNVFSAEETDKMSEWGFWPSIAVLVSATVLIALEAEIVSEDLSAAAGALHLSNLFVGVVILGLVGTSADIFAACWFAHRDNVGLALTICIGSAIQVALVVAPLLVIFSWVNGRPMNLVFSNPLHLFAIAATAFVVNAIARDAETTWFEGLLLVGVYILFGIAFFFAGPG